MTKRVQLFSDRVLKVPPGDLSATRYKWLKLSEAEPDFGAPTVDGAIIFSDTTGQRFWSTSLTTDSTGNLITAGVSIVGNKITANQPGEDLELGTTDDAVQNVKVLSGLIVEGDLTVNGNFAGQGDLQLDNINLSAGSTISIDNVEVLSETTLGSGVVNSSLETVGTITTGTWQATPIGTEYGGTGIGEVGTGITQNAMLYGDGVNAMREVSGTAFQVLQLDSSGTPVFGGLDGGGY